MISTDITKGARVRLRNGWEAVIEDNLRKGHTRLAKVFGRYTEIGSIYVTDIVSAQNHQTGQWEQVEYTQRQKDSKARREAAGF